MIPEGSLDEPFDGAAASRSRDTHHRNQKPTAWPSRRESLAAT